MKLPKFFKRKLIVNTYTKRKTDLRKLMERKHEQLANECGRQNPMRQNNAH